MAVVKTLSVRRAPSNNIHLAEVDCECARVVTQDGHYLQLDTRRSAGSERPGKLSQTLQFDAAAGRQLKKILEQLFPG
jgi:hypothetical protein